jgi:tRNA nucleotidyltransferase/poly(A) polymerase
LTALNELVPDAFLVGGAIRDVLLHRRPRGELDVVIRGDGLRVGRRLADHVGPALSFVPLDPKRGIARLVLDKGKGGSIDISPLKGDTIQADLPNRDFTVNAIAVKVSDLLATGLEKLIDPLEGLGDLKAGRVRACSRQAFKDDPLRILRAFRLNASLGFEICADTIALIASSLSQLRAVTQERIRDELIAILAEDRSWNAVLGLDRQGIIDALFPELLPMKGATQNRYHHLDVWGHTLETIHQMEIILENRTAFFRGLSEKVDTYTKEEAVVGRPRKALLKLAAIFHDAGKPHCVITDEDGRLRFFGHEKVSREIFEEVGYRLKLAGREIRTIGLLIEGHMRPMILTGPSVTRRAAYRLCRSFQRDLVGLLLLFLADLGASRGPAREAGAYERALEQIQMILTLMFESEERPPAPLLNGRDLIRLFGLEPGPYLGGILKTLAELQGSGEINTPEEALAFVKGIIGEDKP